MAAIPNRRSFLKSYLAFGGGLAFLDRLPPVAAQDAKPDPAVVRLDSGIEPLVELLEVSPRDKLLEEVGARIKKGLPYRDVLTALLLAGVRNIQPRPAVGFKFHAVLVINSAHQAAMAAPDRERWLPLFWALDNFKSAQATNKRESGWRMKPVNELKVPTAAKARKAFEAAMDAWDEEADAAAAGLARCDGPGHSFDLFAQYGCRDFRDIGHKAIYVANAFRTLSVIGWQHAEPVLRSLAFALLKHDGKNPAKSPQKADEPGLRNAERVAKLKVEARLQPATVAIDLLTATRTLSEADLCEQVATHLSSGTPPREVWSGLLLAAAELLMRQPGIVALHSLTSLNALRYAASVTADRDLQKMLLLQATAFVPLFRDAMKARGKLNDAKIDVEIERFTAKYNAADVFRMIGKNKSEAFEMAFGLLREELIGGSEYKWFTDEARRLIFLKGTDSHDYKFSSAVIEDSEYLEHKWRARFLSASLFWMKGADAPDSPLVARTRAALA